MGGTSLLLERRGGGKRRNIGVEGWRGLTIGRSKKGRRALIEGVGLGLRIEASWFPWHPSFCCTESEDSVDFRIQRIYSSNSLCLTHFFVLSSM